MLETLTAQIQLRRKEVSEALQTLQQAAQRFPHVRALTYALIDAKVGAGGTAYLADALSLTERELLLTPGDARLHHLQAKAYAAEGKRLRQHRAQAEAYMAEGQLDQAILQLVLARKAEDGNFYEHSEVDARLRELKQRKLEELRERQRR
jgi:predicted Zn-dependent protease